MRKRQFLVLYRQFLFRMVDMEALSSHAQGDSTKLLGRFASILIMASIVFSLQSFGFAGSGAASLRQTLAAWDAQHFLISTTMLVVGLFAVLSWDSTFPNRTDVMVLGPLPVRGATLFAAKVAAVATALGLTVATLHVVTGLCWPVAFSRASAQAAPALTYLPAMPPVKASALGAVLDSDLAQALKDGPLAAGTGAGAAIGVLEHGTRHVFTYGAAQPDSLFEIGSITKTFTGLLLAQMTQQEQVTLFEPVRELLPPGTVLKPAGKEIRLLDLATQHSGLPPMPDNFEPSDKANPYADYAAANLYAYLRRHGVAKETRTPFVYSNLGFGLLGQALAERARIPYPELTRHTITDPLGMADTVVRLSAEQERRFLPGYDGRHRPVHAWDLDALAGAGGLRSTAGDMLAYLAAQLHPEALGPETGSLGTAIAESHRLRALAGEGQHIALAWFYRPHEALYWHSGATAGFTSMAFFSPKHDYAAILLLNSGPGPVPFIELLGEHVRQRLAGDPALSLDSVAVPGNGGGAAGVLRAFAAYWIAMLAAGGFIYCCVLGMQGMTAQLLPRRWFLRASSFLQLAAFAVFVCGYFLLRPPQYVLIAGSQKPLLAWVPTYWFVGLFQQLNGTLHPALAPLARRAWAGLAIAAAVTAVAYTLSYLRTMRQVVEEPDIVPGVRGGMWLPRFGGALATAVVRFAIRTVMRSRQHRVILAFYLAIGFALAILVLQTPASQELAQQGPADPWHQVSGQLIAASVVLMAVTVIGMRALFGLPLELRSNWVFRVTPVPGGTECMSARRRGLLVLAVAPVWSVFAVLLFSLWPWRGAAAHLALLGLTGLILAEFCLRGPQKIPFTCSYLPGKTNFHMGFWIGSVFLFFGLVTQGAELERRAVETPWAMALLLSALAAAWWTARWWTTREANSDGDEARFEDTAPDEILSLNLTHNAAS